MAKGAESKQTVTNKILEVFPGSFIYGKELRIPMMEGGAEVQIKVALTCAKDNVESGMDVAIPGATPAVAKTVTPAATNIGTLQGSTPVEPSAEEKKNVEDLLSTLGLM